MITRKFAGIIHKAAGAVVNAPAMIELAYDEENNPLAVQMIITVAQEGDVVWTFSRDLMTVGCQSLQPVGRGDVKFRCDPSKGQLLVCLKNPTGHADLGLPIGEVAEFLADTAAAAPIGSEELESHIDELIEELLS